MWREPYIPTGGYVVQESYTAAVQPMQLEFLSIVESLKTMEMNKNNCYLLTHRKSWLL